MYALNKLRELDPKRIVIFRALHLGDLLNAVPAFRALKITFPQSQISLVGLPWSEAFVNRFRSYLDGFISFPGFPGLPEQTPNLARLLSVLDEIQSMNFDLAIQMQGSGEIANPLIGLFGAKQSAGFYVPGQYCPDKNWYLEYPKHEPEALRHVRLMEFLGIPVEDVDLELPLFEEDWKGFQQIKEKFRLEREYVCIHPGAHVRERRWPSQHFAAVADHLTDRGHQIVLTGTEEEAHLTASVALHMKAPAIDLAGKTQLGTLGALIAKARLVISNDTGISHVAAALKTPSVILFPIPYSIRWAPQNEKLHSRVWQAMEKNPNEILPYIDKQLDARIYTPIG